MAEGEEKRKNGKHEKKRGRKEREEEMSLVRMKQGRERERGFTSFFLWRERRERWRRDVWRRFFFLPHLLLRGERGR